MRIFGHSQSSCDRDCGHFALFPRQASGLLGGSRIDSIGWQEKA